LKAGDDVTLAEGPHHLFALHAKAPPISDAQRLAQSMLGLTPREPTVADRARMKLGASKGLLVEAITPDGPAHKAGLLTGDLVVQLGRYRIAEMSDLAVLLGQATPGTQADVYVIRRGRLGRVRLTLGSTGSQI
jgi:S1-C subfamily serine protease